MISPIAIEAPEANKPQGVFARAALAVFMAVIFCRIAAICRFSAMVAEPVTSVWSFRAAIWELMPKILAFPMITDSFPVAFLSNSMPCKIFPFRANPVRAAVSSAAEVLYLPRRSTIGINTCIREAVPEVKAPTSGVNFSPNSIRSCSKRFCCCFRRASFVSVLVAACSMALLVPVTAS